VRLIELGSEPSMPRRHSTSGIFPGAWRMIVNLGGSEISPICQFPVDASTRIGAAPCRLATPRKRRLLLLDEEGEPGSRGQSR